MYKVLISLSIIAVLLSCKDSKTVQTKEISDVKVTSKYDCHPTSGRPAYLAKIQDSISEYDKQIRRDTSLANILDGMKFIPDGNFMMGAVGDLALEREFPKHPVKVSGFYMDDREVTNAEFREFVEATGYKTIAERPVDWEELKTQLPPGTPKPADDLLKPGSLVFTPTPGITNLRDFFSMVVLGSLCRLAASGGPR